MAALYPTPKPALGRLRTASTESIVDVHSPIPDLQTMHGAYLKNIEKLEQSAEELSQGGSDIGEEIRKMKQEQDRASRRSSMVSRLSSSASASLSASASAPSQPGQVLTRSRNASTSSYANSIVDLNSTARWGGYSPGGYITSPSVSRVSSFHRPSGLPEPVQEGRPLDSPLASPNSFISPTRRPSQQSMARTDDIMSEHLDLPEGIREEKEEHDDDRDMMRRQHSGEQVDEGEQMHPEHQKHHDEQEMLQDDTHSHSQHYDHEMSRPHSQHYDHDPHPQSYDHDLSHPADYRSSTPDTYRQARSLFRDFDGVHFSPTTDEFVEVDESGNEVNRLSSQEFKDQMMQDQVQQHQQQLMQQRMSRMSAIPRPLSYAHPPPGENMTFYPAPVPRMLNLPKRLSQLPAANVQAQRRSQVLNPLPVESRKSAMWIPALDFQTEEEDQESRPSEEQSSEQDQISVSDNLAPPKQRQSMMNQRQSMMNPRLSRMSMANLPPQLRASVYFDRPSVQQDIKVRESAGATLDSILAASVNAPVNVFTDHPFAGHVGSEVYGRAQPQNRKSTLINYAKSADPAQAEPIAEEHKRTASSGTTGAPVQKRNSIVSMLTDLGNPAGNKLKKRNSRMSLAPDLGLSKGEDGAYALGESEEQAAEHQGETASLRLPGDEDQEAGADEDNYEEEQFEEKYPFFAQPTTLLAELQARKAQQKTRNRTAYNTVGVNGMHSTLLQLDAVAQIEKEKKQRQRTRLAWEDPMLEEQDRQEEDEDEDVPLGVLYPERNGLVNRGKGGAQTSDWNKPLGLLERRELEDNEPLARRRNRLRGISPDHHLRVHAQQQALLRQQREAEMAAATVPLPEDEEEDEHANESLGERLRRLKRKEALSAALGDLAGEDESKRMSAFTDEVLGHFGASDGDDKDKPKDDDKPAESKTTNSSPIIEQSQDRESETLGQRRARLQREREQRNVSNPDSAGASTVRPPLQTSVSLANLLAVHPIEASTTKAGSGRNRHEPAPGSLLAVSNKAELDATKKLRAQNVNYNTRPKSSFNPALAYQQQMQTQAQMGMQQQQQQQQLQMQMQMQIQAMSRQLQQFPSQQSLYPQQMYAGHNPMAMYPQFAQPTAYAGMAGMGYQQQQQQQYGGVYGNMAGQYGNAGMMMQPHPMTAGTGQPYAAWDEASLNQGQRDLIDRWRLSVAQ